MNMIINRNICDQNQKIDDHRLNYGVSNNHQYNHSISVPQIKCEFFYYASLCLVISSKLKVKL